MSSFDGFLDAIESASSRMDNKTFWPGGGARLCGSFIDLDAKSAYDALSKITVSRRPAAIAESFPSASAIRYFVTGNYLVGLKIERDQRGTITSDDIAESVGCYLDALRLLSDDPFCLNGGNVYRRAPEFNEENLSALAPSQAARLSVSLDSLVWSLFFDVFVAGGLEISGPYPLASGEWLIVKDYFDLKPSALWPEFEGVGYEHLKLYQVYAGAKPQVDFYMHVFSTEPLGRFVARAYLSSVERGTEQSVGVDSDKLAEAAVNASDCQVARVNAMTALEKIECAARIAFYQSRGLKTAVGEDWRPGGGVASAVASRGLQTFERFAPKPADRRKPISVRELYDPYTTTYRK